eukprot:jgi/Ulvmu1/4253/UM193_0001.1
MSSPSKRQNTESRRRQIAGQTLNVEVIKYVQSVFKKADLDGGGDLDENEFAMAFAGKLNTDEGSDADCMRKLFYRIDANSDGAVDWDEFSMYMMLENQGCAAMCEAETVRVLDPPQPGPVEDAHKKLTQCCTMVPPCGGSSQRYATGGRDGVVKLWSCKDLSVERTINVANSWVTAVKYMPALKCLAVTTFSRNLTMFDITSPFCTICGAIPKMEYTPMTMDIWSQRGVSQTEMVIVGDSGGLVHLHRIQPNTKQNVLQDVADMERSKGRPKAVDKYREETVWSQIVHSNWVSHVLYVPELESALSCSLDTYLWLMDVERRTPFMKLEGHTKGVHSCNWSALHRVFVSGGADKTVCLFNPFSGKKQAALEGHSATISDVLVNDSDHQIISLSLDKVVKVWDIRTYKCLQTITDRTVYHPEDALGAVLFDGRHSHLVTANLALSRWPLRDLEGSGAHGHCAPVTAVLYNRVFGDAVSGDRAGTVCVWNTRTGRLRFRFTHTHGSHAITALAFDGHHRRLFTGCEGGRVKAWNFSSGACLKDMVSPSTRDVTGIICTRGSVTRYIISVGWDRKLTFFEDLRAKEVPYARQVPSGHRDAHAADILAAALMHESSNLVTAADDGTLRVWSVESGTIRRTLEGPGVRQLPEHRRGVEALAFMHGARLKHVCISVGADQFARFWDIRNCVLLHQHFTGHYLDESVVAIAITPDNGHLVTGDTQGIVRTWDLSNAAAALADSEPASPSRVRVRPGAVSVPACARWRAHSSGVSSATAIDGRSDLVLTSGQDCTVALWSIAGAKVGVFGQCDWALDDPGTWASCTAEPLGEEDARMLSASTPLLPLSTLPAHSTSRPGSAASGGFATVDHHRGSTTRPSTARPSMLSLRPATPAKESVQPFLSDPEVLARMDNGDTASTDGSSADDADIPDILRVPAQCTAQHGASCTGSLAGGSRASVSRPQTCRGHRSTAGTNRLDGPLASPRGSGWGDGRSVARPQTAHAGSVLSAQEKLERRKGYKAPRPPVDGLTTFSRAAQARFRT